jgi:hypothetical protein
MLKDIISEARATIFSPVRLKSYKTRIQEVELDAHLVINHSDRSGFQVEIDQATE